MNCRIPVVVLISLYAVPFAGSQLQPSDALQRTQCKFQDQTEVTVEYGGIQRNGRKIFGEFVPYGHVWEMGDKRSPSFVTSANLVIGGKEVLAGHYNIATIPNPHQWTMIVRKTTGKSSTDRIEEVARVELTVRALPSPRENFTISFDQLPGGCVLNLRWEQTEASTLLAEKK